MQQLLTFDETCALLKISRATLSRLVADGDLPFIALRKGPRKNLLRFDPDAVTRWVQSRTTTGVKNRANGNGRGYIEATETRQIADMQQENDANHRSAEPEG